MRDMALTVDMVTIDCADPRTLAVFWQAALDMKVASDFDGAFLVLQGGGRVALGLQRVPEPRSGKNRVHLDLASTDRAAEVARLVSLGATTVGEHTLPGFAWTVLTDPDGNEFCVGQPE